MELGDIDYAELRKSNLADNKRVLAQLMNDIHKMIPVKAEPKRKYKSYRKSLPVEGEIRRNPSRSARFNPLNVRRPSTRARSGSLSSMSSGVSGSSVDSCSDRMVVKFGFFGCSTDLANLDSEIDLDDSPAIKRVAVMRDERSADEITDDDLKMVATFVSEKKYDSIYGSSCHQCRQKTDDMKTICRSGHCNGIRGQFCGPCLRNRYGEDAKMALKDPEWVCPPCRQICNCSFCRKKAGKSCTGILIHLARENGFSNVNEYLQSLKRKIE